MEYKNGITINVPKYNASVYNPPRANNENSELLKPISCPCQNPDVIPIPNIGWLTPTSIQF